MGTISYDPIKNRFAGFIRHSRLLRTLFYNLLDLFFLRSWHIRRILKNEGVKLDRRGSWRLLDAGCGFGQYDRFILNRFENVEVLAIDVKEDYLEDCKFYFQKEIGEGRIAFRQADLLKFEPGPDYDFILCIDVLEHIEEDQAAIRNLARSLRPGGRLLIHSPSHYSGEDAGDDESFVGEQARAGYSKRDIQKKYKEAELQVDNLHYTYGRYGHMAWLLSVKFPMLLLNRVGMAGLLLLLFYYPLVLLPCLLLNTADQYTGNVKGNGIYALGSRPARNSDR
jgi:SAM-dependent methyltransferase